MFLPFKKISWFAFFSLMFLSFHRDGEELLVLDQLISTTNRQLDIQKQLRGLVQQFMDQQKFFYEEQTTKEVAVQMIETSRKILQIAKENHYLHLLTPLLIKDLKFVAEIGEKSRPNP